jgi:hypothetical protein
MTNRKQGRCACGNIEYSYAGDPINIAFCYCKDCQTHTGSDKYLGVWAPTDSLQVDKGEPTVFTRLGDSGEPTHHHFCKDGGVTLYVEATVANIVSIAAVTLDDSENLVPAMAIYTASASKWAILPEGISHFEKLPPGIG